MTNEWKYPSRPQPRTASIIFCLTLASMAALVLFMFVNKAIPQYMLDRACAVEVCG